MFNKIGNGELAQADGRISVCFGLNISGCLYLSPPHQYRQNLTKSWISPARAETAGPIRVWIYWIWIYPQNGSNMWRWRGMLGISDSLFTICQARAALCAGENKSWLRKMVLARSRRRHKLPEEDANACQRLHRFANMGNQSGSHWEEAKNIPAPDSIAVSLFGNMIG